MELEAKVLEHKDNMVKAQVTISKNSVDAEVKAAYGAISNNYQFPGFRKGHVPRQVVDANYGHEGVMALATNQLLEQADPLIMSELDIVCVGKIDAEDLKPAVEGESYTFELKIPVEPEEKLSSYAAVSIEMPPEEVTDAELENQIEIMLSYQAQPKDLAKDAKSTAETFMNVKIEDVKNADSFAGTHSMRPDAAQSEDLAKGLIGMKVGETKEIAFHEDNAKGQPIERVVKVTVEKMFEFVTPNLTEEIAKTMGFDSIDALKDGLKKEIEASKRQQLPELKRTRCVQALTERLDKYEQDKDFVAHVRDDIARNFMNRLQAQGQTVDSFIQQQGISTADLLADISRQAETFAKESIAVDALVRERKIEATKDDVYDEFAAAGFEDVDKAIQEAFDDGRLPQVKEAIRRHKATDWLVETAKVSEVDEIAKRRQEEKKSASTKKASAPKKKSTGKKAADKKEEKNAKAN